MTTPPIERNALPKVLQRYADKIHSVSDERGYGEGYWVILRNGWLWDNDTHQIHEDSPTACARRFNQVRPCDCEECLKGME